MVMLYLHGVGHFHPENVIDNAFLEALDIGTNEEWIVSRVGIEQRRTVLPLDYLRETKNCDLRAAPEAALYSNAQTGARAAEMALARAGLSRDDIGMVIAGGCSPDSCIPAEGAAIAHALGIECPAFDLHSACSSFGAQLHFLSQLGDAAPEYALCVVPENITRVTDFRDRATAVLFGDGTAAAVVSNKHLARARLLHSEFGAAPSGAWDVTIPRTGYFGQNGTKVQKFAIRRMGELFNACRAKLPTDRAQELVFIGHQANLTMLKSVVRRSRIPAEQHWFNIVTFGNQSSAGAPIVLSQRWDEVADGALISLVVVGSGLSWSSLLFEFSAHG